MKIFGEGRFFVAVVGVICEYNPFHRGHRKQFLQIRQQFGEDTRIVCMMSGNFVQQGEPAVLNKFDRARVAVDCGADLVLELPITAALSSAEGFAAGGVAALSALGVVDYLCFGSESADLPAIQATARALLTPEYNTYVRQAMEEKISYAAARQKALERIIANCPQVTSPNDNLAVEYCKAILRQRSGLEPVALYREGDFHSPLPSIRAPSARSLRALSHVEDWRPYVPDEAMEIYSRAELYRLIRGERAILARLRTMSSEEYENLPFASEGLCWRFASVGREAVSVEDVIANTKSKRYARSRICRMLMCAYLGLTAEDLRRPISYLRVLAADQQGIELLHQAKKTARVPILNAGATPEDEDYYRMECRCADLYTLFSVDSAPRCRTEQQGRTYLRKK